jgi:hypothetical protein
MGLVVTRSRSPTERKINRGQKCWGSNDRGITFRDMESEYRQAAERAAEGWRRHGNRFAFHHRDRTILE